ncbi:MAG TPA: methyltransferase [Bryobacteraceae bacterium]|nr:methyltransferase [Bryobacteraceae bacterium]
MPSLQPHPPRVPSPEEARSLRRAFAECGYNDSSLVAKLGGVELPTPRSRTLPRMVRLTAGGTPLDTLARLFLFSMPVPEEAARAALGASALEIACRLELVQAEGSEVAATAVVHPYGDLLIAYDLPAQHLGAAPDVVMGISASTMDLARFTVRRRARNTLDIGTGCGFHAFLAAEHATQVYAVDYSRRAVAFANFNTALNGLGNVECLYGDRFEPVRGRRFDMIVGNLPFVIAPSSRFLYRDGGMELDGFARGVLREAAECLEDDGLCQIICDWVHIEGQDWKERLRSWFDGTGCDAWIVRLSTAKPLLYAETWLRETEHEDPAETARTFEEWATYYERHRVERISTGLIAMRRAPGRRNWLHLDDWPNHLPEDFSGRVSRGIALCDFLRDAEDRDGLLGARLTVNPEVRLLTGNQWSPDGWRVLEARVGIESWPGHEGAINPNVLHLLTMLDGERTLRDCVSALAVRLHGSFEQVAEACLPVVRELIEGAYLLPREAQ